METHISQKDKDQIEAGIRDKYVKMADTLEDLFQYSTDRAGLEALNYDPGLSRTTICSAIQKHCGNTH